MGAPGVHDVVLRLVLCATRRTTDDVDAAARIIHTLHGAPEDSAATG